jgi:hypothetical protein
VQGMRFTTWLLVGVMSVLLGHGAGSASADERERSAEAVPKTSPAPARISKPGQRFSISRPGQRFQISRPGQRFRITPSGARPRSAGDVFAPRAAVPVGVRPEPFARTRDEMLRRTASDALLEGGSGAADPSAHEPRPAAPSVGRHGAVPGYGWRDSRGGYRDGYWRYSRRQSGWMDPVDGSLPSASAAIMPAAMGDAPEAAVQPEPAPPGVAGRAALRAGDIEMALRLLREHVEREPSDWSTRRLIGLAMIESGRVADGAALVGVTYHEAPELAGKPVDAELFASTRERPRRLPSIIRQVGRWAHRTDSASGWVTLASALQASDRPRLALRHVARAEAAGLTSRVAEAFRSALDG